MAFRSLLPALATATLLAATIVGAQRLELGTVRPSPSGSPALAASPTPTASQAESSAPAAAPSPGPSPSSSPAEQGCPPPQVGPQLVACRSAGAAGELFTIAGRGCNNPGGPAIIYFGTSSDLRMASRVYGAFELGRFDVATDGSFTATVRVPYELRPIQNTGGGPVLSGTYEVYSKPHLCRTPFRVTAPVSVSARPSALGAYFDSPPEHPGYQWTRDGRPVSGRELTTAAAPGHCDWESATFLTIGWPLGTVSTTSAQARQFIRDPEGVVSSRNLQNELELHAKLPRDAVATGYRYRELEIYLSASDQDWAIYVVGPAGAERWPRSDPMTLCL